MARQPRFIIPGQPQHVIQRGNNRDVIFVSEADYLFYLEKLSEACEEHQCDIHAYVLMTNHVHLLMTPHKEHSIAKVMQTVGRYYVQYFNYTYQRTGTLWEGRYRATLIDSETYLLSCYRYIELNPVRAGIAEHPANYRWSSYRCNAQGKADRLVTFHGLYLGLAATDKKRLKVYCDLFSNQMNEEIINEIRITTNKAWVLGSDRFKAKIEKLISRQASPKKRGGHNRKRVEG